MIRNILFDMGNVLLPFEPRRFIAQVTQDADDAALLLRVVYGSAEWVEVDRGIRTEREMAEYACTRLPTRLHEAARRLVLEWDGWRRELDGMEPLLRELTEAGYRLCLLSNAGLRHHEYWPQHPCAKYFGERLMISADWQLLKPERAFYEKAFELLGVDRRESVFVDDNAVNVEAARRCGLDGIVFWGDAALLRQELRARGVGVAE